MVGRRQIVQTQTSCGDLRPLFQAARRVGFAFHENDLAGKRPRNIAVDCQAIPIYGVVPSHVDRHGKPDRQAGVAVAIPDPAPDESDAGLYSALQVLGPLATGHGRKPTKMMDNPRCTALRDSLPRAGRRRFQEERQSRHPVAFVQLPCGLKSHKARKREPAQDIRSF